MAKKQLPVVLRQHAELPPPETGQVLVSVSVGPDNEAIALWSTPTGRDKLQARVERPNGTSFAASTTDGTIAHVVSYAPQPTSTVIVPDLRVAHCHVQPLPGGRVLIVGARLRSADADRNALIFNPDGRIARSGTLGDGIEHVRTTPSGKIWVGYFDEGIYGGGGDGGEPLGAPGIVRYTGRLQPEWRFPVRQDLDPIADCYALNVAGESAWATYYSDFPVVRITDDMVRSWPGARTAANALIVAGTRCALIGGYGGKRDRVLVGDLDRGHFKPYRLTLPDESRLPDRAQVIGRGPDLHVFVDSRWFRLSLDDLP
ncbi:MAG TPA: hypothetical protein VFX61_22975 [Micromonosporaceae bacterium]|nr:hypothetical protein [Micromonosporaceae bacterium]